MMDDNREAPLMSGKLITTAAALTLLGTVSALAVDGITPQSQDFGPSNDDFANAEALNADPYLIPGDLSRATRELSEVKVLSSGIGRTVWYKYTPTKTGRAVVALVSRYYTAPFQFAVYTGDKLTALTKLRSYQIPGTDTAYSGGVGFNTVAGRTYYVQVDTATRSNGFWGSFLIGVQQIETTGNIGAFLTRPLIFQENDFDTYINAYIVNGHTGPVQLTHGLGVVDGKISTSTTKSLLALGEATVYTFSDASPDYAPGSTTIGSLDVMAKATSNNTYLGNVSVPLTLLTTEYTYQPKIRVHFQDPAPGVSMNARASTTVAIENRSSVDALGCRFDAGQYDYDSALSLNAREISNTGSLGPRNPVFRLAAGETKKFNVSLRSADDNYNYAQLKCADYYASITNTNSAYFNPQRWRGLYPNLEIRPTTDNALGEVALADFGSKRVIVKVRNIGAYSGYFTLRSDYETYEDRAVVTAMCVVNTSNACVGPSDPNEIEFDMAVGETRRIAVDVRRGSSLSSGEVELQAAASDYSSYNSAGLGAFTVIKK